MTLAEITQDGYKVFSKQHDPKKSNNLAAIQYIQHLASQTNYNVREWNILEAFGVKGKERELVHDPIEINRVFFGRVLKETKEKQFPIQTLTPDVAEALEVDFKKAVATSIRRNDEMIAGNFLRARDYYLRYEKELKAASDCRSNNDALLGREASIAKQIDAILQKNFYEFVHYEAGRLTLRTRGPIVCRYIEPVHAVDLQVDFGVFDVVIMPRDSIAFVSMYEGNTLLNSRIYHPHVDSQGKICWGNAKDTVAKLIIGGKWGDVLEILASVLTNYCPDQPYARIADFHKHQQILLESKKKTA